MHSPPPCVVRSLPPTAMGPAVGVAGAVLAVWAGVTAGRARGVLLQRGWALFPPGKARRSVGMTETLGSGQSISPEQARKTGQCGHPDENLETSVGLAGLDTR